MLEEAFKRAESSWRKVLDNQFPLFSPTLDFKVQDGREDKMWYFATDCKRNVKAHIYNRGKLENLLNQARERLFNGEPLDRLEEELFKYLLLHECPGHWFYSPESVEDRKRLSEAIYKGILKRDRNKKTAFKKAANVRNLVLDIIADTQIFMEKSFNLRDGIIPLFDVVEIAFHRRIDPSNALYGLSRIIYSLFCAEDELRKFYLQFFVRATPLSNTEERAIRMLKALDLKIRNLDSLIKNYSSVLKALVDNLSNRDRRYKVIEDFCYEIADLIPLDFRVGRPSENGGGSTSDLLTDLLDVLDDQEINELLTELSSEKDEISEFAADEFYKRNSGEIDIKSPIPQIRSKVKGERRKWKLVRSEVLSAEELSKKYDIRSLIQFQASTGLPTLIEISPGIWRVMEYKLKTTPLRTYTWEPQGIILPSYVVFWVDSSGSMRVGGKEGFESYVGSRNKYDRLMRVMYGLLKGLYKASKAMERDVKVGVVNYSSQSIWSGFYSLSKVFESYSNPFKKILLNPQWGATEIEPKVVDEVETEIDGNCIHVIISDGDLQSTADKVIKRFKEIASKKDRAIVFVEIRDSGIFGEKMKELSWKNKNVYFLHVNEIEEILGIKGILIQYQKISKFYA